MSQHTANLPARPRPANRRAMALIIAVTLLSVTNLIVTGMIAASGDDAYIGKLRLDAIRCEYAVESAITAALRQFNTDPATPLTGTLTYPGNASATIVTPFAASPAPPGTLTVSGTSGQAQRRMSVTIE